MSPILYFQKLKILQVHHVHCLNADMLEKLITANKLVCLHVVQCSGLDNSGIRSVGNAITLEEVKLRMVSSTFDFTPLARLNKLKCLQLSMMKVQADFIRPICRSISGLTQLELCGVGGLRDDHFKDIGRLTSLKLMVLLLLPSVNEITSKVFLHLRKLTSLCQIKFGAHICNFDTMQNSDLEFLNNMEKLKKLMIMTMHENSAADCATVTRI